jgi:small GTP-binding protein
MSGVDYVFKLLTLGESSVGKSSIILRYTNGQFNQQLLSTTGIDFKTKIIDHKDEKIKLVIYDTSGQERYRTIAANYYKNADGILFVYDITQKNTLTFNYWLEQIKEKSSIKSIVLFGNKTDLDISDNKDEDAPKREITKEEGEKIAEQYGLKLFEGSAKDDINIDSAILELVDLIYKEKNIQSGEKKQPEKQKVQKLSTKTMRVKKKGACCSNPV